MSCIVLRRGYPLEEYTVFTPDGFGLGMFRIPHGLVPSNATHRPPVLLQHGLLDSSWTWVNNFHNESLAFLLADAGYDVWLSNNRGNSYSLINNHLKKDSKAFWDWSYDQMAGYDLPTNIEFVLNMTGYASLAYAGHSQGTTQAFGAMSLDAPTAAALTSSLRERTRAAAAAVGAPMPEAAAAWQVPDKGWYERRVSLFGALAPVAYLHHQKSAVLTLLADTDVANLFSLFGMKEFLPGSSIIQKLAPTLCKTIPFGCDDFLFLLCGASHHLNQSRIDVYVSETPAGTSVRNMIHWSQGVKHDRFAMYDYGCGLLTCENKKHYGQRTPPEYPLANVTVPTALFSGGNDDLGDPKDVAKLLATLPAATVVHHEEEATYAHLDFTWGVDARIYVYESLMQQISLRPPQRAQ